MKRQKSRSKQNKSAHKSAQQLPTEPVELLIDSISHDGRGVGRFAGKVTFVSNALPGETVLAKLTESKSKYNLADAEQILTPCADRIEPFCPHYQQCGGCDMQHLSSERQLELKQTHVLEQLQRIGQTTPEDILAPLRSAPSHYRRSARIGINQLSSGEPIVGFRRKSSHLLCQIDSCPVLDKRLENIFAVTREQLETLGNIKHITQLDIDLGDEDGFLNVHHKKPLTPEATAAFETIATQYQLTLSFQGKETAESARQSGEDTAAYQLNDLSLSFHCGDFIQVNAGINQQMVDQAIALLNPSKGDQILDLFCGLGNFTLPLTASGAQLTGVEGSETMVMQAQHNARNNKLSNCEFHCANLAENITGKAWYKNPYNKIVLDPPRTGAQQLINQICALKAELILYISCNPGALARDTQALKEQGYKLSKFLVMDMFPQTHHIESMALFVRGKKPKATKKVISGKKLWSTR